MTNIKLILMVVLVFQCCLTRADDDIEDETGSEDKAETITTFEPENFETPEPPEKAYFAESFPEKVKPTNWVISEAMKDGADEATAKYNGIWIVSTPLDIALKNDYCLVATSEARHHAISSKLKRPFAFQSSQPLVVQYDVKFQKELGCGGAYVKLLSEESIDLKRFNDTTLFTIMFGPDKCGHDSNIHFIIKLRNPKNGNISEYKAKRPNKAIDTYFSDKKSHLYRLVLKDDDSYEIFVDRIKITDGNLMETMEPRIVPEKEIDDPEDKKPLDWDAREKIPDPDATKPSDWDEDAPKKIPDINAKQPDDWLIDEPELIPDEKAKKPDDWDEEIDGKWEPPQLKNPKCEKVSGCGKWTPPMIDNPNYKGKWKAPLINNPAYQGKWKPRKIENPDYFELTSVYKSLETVNALGLELWTMTENIAFDNFLITDRIDIADDYASRTWEVKYAAENRRSAKSSIFSTIIQTANDRPWLWAVYLLVVLIPIVLITIFCFGSSKDSKGLAKKTDEPSPDDPAMNEGVGQDAINEQNDVDQDELSQNCSLYAKSFPDDYSNKSNSPVKVTRDDLEENSDEEGQLSSGSTGSKKEESSGGASPRRRIPRKAD